MNPEPGTDRIETVKLFLDVEVERVTILLKGVSLSAFAGVIQQNFKSHSVSEGEGLRGSILVEPPMPGREFFNAAMNEPFLINREAAKKEVQERETIIRIHANNNCGKCNNGLVCLEYISILNWAREEELRKGGSPK